VTSLWTKIFITVNENKNKHSILFEILSIRQDCI